MDAWTLRRWTELERDELYDIVRLRERVFVVEQRCPYLDADDRDRGAWHLWTATPAGELRAYLRILAPGTRFAEASLGRIVTAPEWRATGLGRRLVAEGLRRVDRQFGPVPVRISAQAYLERFYGEFGFARASADYDEDGVPHLQMLRPPH